MLYRLNQPERAIADYSLAISSGSRQVEALTARAACYRQLKRYKECLTDCDAAIALEPREPSCHRVKGECLTDLKRYEAALPELSKTVELLPADHHLWLARADCLRRMHKFSQALADCDRALSIAPGDPLNHSARARCYLSMGDAASAARYIDLATATAPGKEVYWAAAAIIRIHLQDVEGAIQRARRFSRLRGGSLIGRELLLLADWAAREVDDDPAVKFLSALLLRHPEDAYLFASRASVFRHADDLEADEADMPSALKLEPLQTAFLLERANLRRDLGKYKDAVQDLSQAISQMEKGPSAPPDSRLASTLVTRAKMLERLYGYRRSLPDYTKAGRLNPSMYLHRAQAAERAGDFESAARDYTVIIDRNPAALDNYDARARVYASQRSYRQELSDLNTLIKLAPGSPELYRRRARCHEHLGGEEAAKKDIATYRKLTGTPPG